MKGEAPATDLTEGSATPSGVPTHNPLRGNFNLFVCFYYFAMQSILLTYCENVDPTSVSLDKYLANNTTEDNASFIEIVEDAERKREAKLAPFFPSRSPTDSQRCVRLFIINLTQRRVLRVIFTLFFKFSVTGKNGNIGTRGSHLKFKLVQIRTFPLIKTGEKWRLC